jgi:glycosyltransferase involved in cell wall biosynthesis
MLIISPKVSIVLPVYNAAQYLGQCIDSLLCQTFKDFELLIINDGSTDDSLNIIRLYAEADSRIRVIEHLNNIGLISVLNQSVEQCRGQYIARMDADDWSEPERLQIQFDYLESHPRVGIVGSWIKLFGDKNEVWHYRNSDNFIKILLLFKTNGFPHNSIMLRKTVIEEFKYGREFKYIEDAELWLRIMLEKPDIEFVNIPKLLTHYRIWPHQTSSLHLDEQNSGYKKIIRSALNQLISGFQPHDLRCHFQLIEFDSTSSCRTESVGQWVQKLSLQYNKFKEDEYHVIAEKWLKYCLKATKSSEEALYLYNRFKPENMKFNFLLEAKY